MPITRRRMLHAAGLGLGSALLAGCSANTPAPAVQVPRLRLGVQMTPEELASFRPLVEQLRGKLGIPIELEETPQASFTEKLNAQAASRTLPDVQYMQGLFVQPFIRQGVFRDLSELVEPATLDDLYPAALVQYRDGGKLWAVPFSVAPDLVFFNTAMFDAAGLEYPTDEWSFEQMRAVARRLTLDANGRNAEQAGFEASQIQQWGWGVTPVSLWSEYLVLPLGGAFCASEDCSSVRLTAPETLAALQWWAEMVQRDRSALYDPYGGSQTGVPGEALLAGKAAMSVNGFFAVGQLNRQGTLAYDIVQPLSGPNGQRATALSVTGFVIAQNSTQPEAAWRLIQELTSGEVMAQSWARPGHGIPARRSVAEAVLDSSREPRNQRAILAALEYAQVLRPYSAGALEIYSRIGGLFQQALTGERPLAEAMAEAETIANRILARDRG